MSAGEGARRLRGTILFAANILVSVGWSVAASVVAYHTIKRDADVPDTDEVARVFD